MQKGFTLLELLIAITILSIVAGFSYTFSIDYLTRARRLDGQTALLDLANRMENYYAKTGSYETATIATGAATDLLSTRHSEGGWYDLSIAAQSQSTYVLEARAKGMQKEHDGGCNLLFIDHVGLKSAAGKIGKNKNCWS